MGMILAKAIGRTKARPTQVLPFSMVQKSNIYLPNFAFI